MQKLKQKLNVNTVGVALLGDPQIKNNTNPVGATIGRPRFEGITLKNQKGITLIALIITIIVMLILVGVTINVALNGGLFTKAEQAANSTTVEAEKEVLSMAAIAAWDLETGVDFSKIELPEGFSGSDGTYTSSKSGKTYKVDQVTAKVTEGENVTEVEKIVTAEDEEYSYWKTDGNGTIIYYELPEGVAVPETLVIPCQIGDERIITIGDFALMGMAVQRNTDCSAILNGPANLPTIIPEETPAIAKVKNVVISKGINQIGRYAFCVSEKLEKITFSSSINEVGERSFSECSLLSQINFTEGIVSIRQEAFNGCSSLTEVTIPSTVDNMEGRAFGNCENLQIIHVKGKTEEPVYYDGYTGTGWSHAWKMDSNNAEVLWEG